MTTYRTTRPLTLRVADNSFQVPTGAQVLFVKGQGGGYALRDPGRYGLNAHDAAHRWAWVPADAVETIGEVRP